MATAMAACGDDGGHRNPGDGDAGPPDAAVDAAPQLGTCGVHVVAPPGMIARDGLPVLFHDRAGALLDSTTTDADGQASYDDCGPSTTVTLLVRITTIDRNLILTYGGIEPGQTIAVGLPSPAPVTAPASEVEVTFSDTGAPATATHYTVSAGGICNSTDTPPDPQSFSLMDGCLGADPDHIDVLATARDDDDQIVGFDFATGVAVAAGTLPIALDGWEEPATAAVSVSHMTATAPPPKLSLVQYRDDIPFMILTAATMELAGDDATAAPLALPAAFTDEITYRINVDGGGGHEHTFFGKSAPGDDIAVAMDEAPPRVAGHLVSLADPSRPRATIVVDDDLGDSDLVSFQLLWDSGSWALIEPAQTFTGEVQLPDLPDALSDYGPAPTSVITAAVSTVVRLSGFTYPDLLEAGWLTGAFAGQEKNLEPGQSLAAASYGGPL